MERTCEELTGRVLFGERTAGSDAGNGEGQRYARAGARDGGGTFGRCDRASYTNGTQVTDMATGELLSTVIQTHKIDAPVPGTARWSQILHTAENCRVLQPAGPVSASHADVTSQAFAWWTPR
jgi:hypothetical protein